MEMSRMLVEAVVADMDLSVLVQPVQRVDEVLVFFTLKFPKNTTMEEMQAYGTVFERKLVERSRENFGDTRRRYFIAETKTFDPPQHCLGPASLTHNCASHTVFYSVFERDSDLGRRFSRNVDRQTIKR